ncbi:MAG TPA: hypothetical protein VF159_01935 [Gemmatimonadaceae bacterium]
MFDLPWFGMLLLKGIVLPGLGLVVLYASAWLPRWIATKVTNQRAAGILERLAQLAFTVVQEVQQTVVSSLDKAAPDRTKQLEAARDQAIATLKSHLGAKGLSEIQDALKLADDTAVEQLIKSFIESAVLMLKQQEGKS